MSPNQRAWPAEASRLVCKGDMDGAEAHWLAAFRLWSSDPALPCPLARARKPRLTRRAAASVSDVARGRGLGEMVVAALARARSPDDAIRRLKADPVTERRAGCLVGALEAALEGARETHLRAVLPAAPAAPRRRAAGGRRRARAGAEADGAGVGCG
jgi:hypothetical protein